MKFNISFGNLPDPDKDPKSLRLKSAWDDMTRYLSLALQASGHQVTVGDTVERDAINIFIERFHDFRRGQQLIAEGYRYGLICTEPLNQPGLYNPFEYQSQETRRLYEEFAEAARSARFVWYLFEEAAGTCRSFNPNSHMLEFRFVDGYAQMVEPAARPAPAADFLVSGQPTKWRANTIETLQLYGLSIVASAGFKPTHERHELMMKARATLSAQKSEGHAMFSIARVYHALMNRVPLLIEYDGPLRYLSGFCAAATPAQLVETAVWFARRPDLSKLAQDFHDAFRASRSAKEAIDETMGLTFSGMSL